MVAKGSAHERSTMAYGLYPEEINRLVAGEPLRLDPEPDKGALVYLFRAHLDAEVMNAAVGRVLVEALDHVAGGHGAAI